MTQQDPRLAPQDPRMAQQDPRPTDDPRSGGPAHGRDRGGPRRSRGGIDEPPGAVYRARRAGVAGLLIAITVVAELFLVRVLLTGEFGTRVDAGTMLAGLFAMMGVPLAAIGLYALVTGAAQAAGPAPARAWLRSPLAYLPVGLLLLIAAGLAAR